MKLSRFKKGRTQWTFVEVSRKEAYYLVASLGQQLASRSPNVGRGEFQTDHGYFTLAVLSEDSDDG